MAAVLGLPLQANKQEAGFEMGMLQAHALDPLIHYARLANLSK